MSRVAKLESAIKCLVFNADGEVLLIRRSPDSPRRPGEWDLPGGALEQAEWPDDCVVREVREETGLTIQKPQVFKAGLAHDAKIGDYLYLFYYVLEYSGQIHLSFEHSGAKWLSLDEAIEIHPYETHRAAL